MHEWMPAIEDLSAVYGRAFDRVELAVRGVNRTYRIYAGQTLFYLRKSPADGRSRSEIEFELEVLSQYENSELTRVAKPIAGLDERHLRELNDEGRSLAILFEEAPGVALPVNAEAGLTTTDLVKLGRHIGHLHDGLQRLSAAGEIALLKPDLAARTVAYLEAVDHGDHPFSEQAYEMGRSVVDTLDGPLTCGLCHGDPWFGNVHFAGDAATFIDFEDCGTGPLVFDLANAAKHAVSWDRGDRAGRVRSIIHGYMQVRWLSPDEIAAVPALAIISELRGLGFLARHNLLSPDQWTDMWSRLSDRLAFWNDPGALAFIQAR